MSFDHFYITTPIYYVNDRPHIGHAYTSVACDALARAMRLLGKRVKFLTGTDEHGQKVEKSAKAAGIAPQAFVDEVSQHFVDLTQTMLLSNDDFIRTTEPRHKQAAQALWRKMAANGDIYLGSYAGWYAVRDEAFYQESELVGGKAPTGAEVEWVEEPSYFFRLSAWQEKLLAFYEAQPDFILPPSRRNEVISFVKGGLKDLSISRTTFQWGIPVPDAPEHIMYVWLDALTNYISALGYPETDGDFADFWQEGFSFHMVGKDILRFHAVYWPAFLMAAGLPLPDRVFAHGWWTIEGEKMSKSLGNVIAPSDLVQQFGVDAARYFLLREVPFGNDGNFSREAAVNRINSELANTIGNLAQRTLSMIHKHCGGLVPEPLALPRPQDSELLARAYDWEGLEPLYLTCDFGQIMQRLVTLGAAGNEYIDREAPWTQKKTDESLMRNTLYHLAECLRSLAIQLQPFTPLASQKLLKQLGFSERELEEGIGFDRLTAKHRLTPGTALAPTEPLFPRIEPS